MKWFPFIVECRDLVEGDLYPGGVQCCKGCHKCSRRNDKVISSPPDKDTGDVMVLEEDGGASLSRILLSFCCEVGFVALSRDEIAKLIWSRRRQVAAEIRARRANNLFQDDGISTLGDFLEASVH